MQPSYKILYEEIISTCSIADLCTKAFSHEKTIERVDTNVVLPSLEDLLPENYPNDGLQTEFNPLNQGISSFLGDNKVVYNEAT